jgi:ribosomal protein S18 acetylase RimI-like enzyme
MAVNTNLVVKAVRHSESAVAAEIHAIQIRAYAQEAKLLGAVYFPPLDRTIADIQASTESYLGAFRDGRLAGALSYCPHEDGAGIKIASLVVDPDFQRSGIGRMLMDSFLAIHPDAETTVQTGVRNGPALSLYARCGFVEYPRGLAGGEPIELAALRRRSRIAQNGA